MFSTPVLLMLFNRPDTSFRVLEAIRALRPRRLFIAADGPRPGRPGEAELCAQARSVRDHVDWQCEVKTLYRAENLGCGLGPAANITWFFSHVEEGIILEDDILPDPSFFPFCEELLARYRNDPQIAAIGGSNHQGQRRSEFSYYFSRYPHCWGWATWRRAWRLYDYHMREWPAYYSRGELKRWLSDDQAHRFWAHFLELMYQERMNTWDYAWTYSAWYHRMLSIIPEVNLTANIGFGPDATHTVDPKSPQAQMRAEPIELPLRHPLRIARNAEADRHSDQVLFRVGELGTTTQELSGQLRAVLAQNGASTVLQAMKDLPSDPDKVPLEILSVKAEALAKAGDTEAATKEATAILKKAPRYEDASRLLRSILGERSCEPALNSLKIALVDGKFADALQLSEQALNAAPGAREVNYLRGLALAKLGRRDEAVLALSAELRADPSRADVAELMEELKIFA